MASIFDALKRTTLAGISAASPSLGAGLLGAYGVSKAANAFKSPPQNNSKSLSSLAALGLSGATTGLKAGLNTAQNTAALSQPTTSSGGNSYGYSNYSGLSGYTPPRTGGETTYNYGSYSNIPFQQGSASVNDEKVTPQDNNQSSSYVNPYNNQLKALQDKLSGLNEGLGGYLKPGQSELDAQAQLDALQGQLRGINASKELGLANVSNQPIAMNFITGQSANLQRQAAAQADALGAQAEPLSTKLARLQADRQQGFEAAKYQIGNAQSEFERLQNESKPIEVGGSLLRFNPATGSYDTVYSAPKSSGQAAEGFTLGEGQMRFDAQGNLLASGAPKSPQEQYTNDIKEYNFAKSQGYGGSFTDYQQSKASGGSSLPSAYREYQLSQSDPGFAQYLNKGSEGLNQQQLNAIQNSPEGKQLLSIQDLQNKLNAYRQEAAQPGGFDSVGSRKAILDSLYADLKIAYKNAAGLGALTGPDVSIITEAIKPISGITNYPGYLASGGQQGVLNSIDQALSTINRQAETNYRSLMSKYPNSQSNSYIQNLNPEIQQLRNAGYSDQQIQQFQQQRGFNSPPSMGVKGSFEQKYPQGATGGQCASFARKLVDIPPLGNGLNDKKAHVDKIGISAAQWRQNPQIGDVIISNDNPTYGHVYVVNQKLPDGRLQVSESNYHNNEKVTHTRIVSPNDPKIYGAIRRPLKV